jgi:hypothetical protein
MASFVDGDGEHKGNHGAESEENEPHRKTEISLQSRGTQHEQGQLGDREDQQERGDDERKDKPGQQTTRP